MLETYEHKLLKIEGNYLGDVYVGKFPELKPCSTVFEFLEQCDLNVHEKPFSSYSQVMLHPENLIRVLDGIIESSKEKGKRLSKLKKANIMSNFIFFSPVGSEFVPLDQIWFFPEVEVAMEFKFKSIDQNFKESDISIGDVLHPSSQEPSASASCF